MAILHTVGLQKVRTVNRKDRDMWDCENQPVKRSQKRDTRVHRTLSCPTAVFSLSQKPPARVFGEISVSVKVSITLIIYCTRVPGIVPSEGRFYCYLKHLGS